MGDQVASGDLGGSPTHDPERADTSLFKKKKKEKRVDKEGREVEGSGTATHVEELFDASSLGAEGAKKKRIKKVQRNDDQKQLLRDPTMESGGDESVVRTSSSSSTNTQEPPLSSSSSVEVKAATHTELPSDSNLEPKLVHISQEKPNGRASSSDREDVRAPSKDSGKKGQGSGSSQLQGTDSAPCDDDEGRKPTTTTTKVSTIATGAIRNLSSAGLKGSSVPLLLSMPAGGGGLSLLSAGLPPGRYVILPSTTSSIPSISSISSTVSAAPNAAGAKSTTVVAHVTQAQKSVLSSTAATPTTTASAATSSAPPTTPLLGPPLMTTSSVSGGVVVHSSGRGGSSCCASSSTSNRSSRGRRKSYTAAEKLAMIEAVESGQKKSNVADQFGVAPSTLACILLQKNKIRNDQIKIDLSRRRLRQNRQMPIVPAAVQSVSLPGSTGEGDGGGENPFVHFLSPLSPARPPVFEDSPEEIVSVPDLSERMTMEGSHASGKLEGGSNYLTCSPILPGMPGMSDDMSEAGPSSGCQDQEGGPERPSGDYEHETVHVKTEPLFNVESEICEDENSENNTQSSCDRRSSQASPTPGMTGPYLLKKETHCSTILDQLLRDDTFCDVTLTAEGQSIRAHKIVLCLASAYFRQVLSKDSTVQNVIVFRDIKFAELKNLINFIYTGEATVDAAELESFMKTAEMLEVTSLCDGQRSLPKNFLSKAKEAAETEKPKPSFGAKRSNTSSSSCANSPPMKSRKIREVSPKSHKSLSYPSTSGGLAPVAAAGHPNVPTPQIKSEPQSDDSVAEEGPYEPREMPAEFYDCAKSPTTRDQDHENDPYADSSDRAPDPMSLENPCPGRCPFCVSAHQQQLRHGLALTSHLATCHQDKIYFCCEICSRVFLRKSFFEGHKDDCNR